ncbi:hypothetical protein [Acidithiobacillus ferrivorans]|uniref:hypothetical protein n=1 Tax=Acidithiobacillus ferrivorans TaxID=160808 RepID=UPI001C0664D3|nr:hypothetical protein [Acidithiobacillus ferrivorans]MBU2850417.1 hypothetical protein [Acidithiobacillus ferrivorans]
MIHVVISGIRGGVYDFAHILQAEIGPDVVKVVPLSASSAAAWEMQAGDSIVLQMSGYEFSKKGAPLWLLREMEIRRHEIKKFGVFFHELYAFGPPWKSAFWLSPVQRYVVRYLAEISDFWMTNREGSAQWLRQYAGDKPHAVLPIFSNIGELQSLSAARKRRLVVFGTAGLRTVTYRTAGREIFQWAKRQSLEIHDIGSPVTDAQVMGDLTANGVIQHGRLEAGNISDLMRDALFGIIAYPVNYIAKSSVFAAYCAHGLCPVVISKRYASSDHLLAKQHYLPGIPTEIVDADKAKYIGKCAWLWYLSHEIACHTASLREFLEVSSR